jgi:hypothetical protein
MVTPVSGSRFGGGSEAIVVAVAVVSDRRASIVLSGKGNVDEASRYRVGGLEDALPCGLLRGRASAPVPLTDGAAADGDTAARLTLPVRSGAFSGIVVAHGVTAEVGGSNPPAPTTRNAW